MISMIDDDIFDDDDFDDEDFDDEDFDDEDFDDLDDDLDMDEDWAVAESVDTGAPDVAVSDSGGASSERTFIQKHFNLIVYGTIGVLAVLWFLGQGGGEKPAPQPAVQPPTVNETADSSLVEMPQQGVSGQGNSVDDAVPETLDQPGAMPVGVVDNAPGLPMPVPIDSSAAAGGGDALKGPGILTPMPIENPTLFGQNEAEAPDTPEPVVNQSDNVDGIVSTQMLEDSPGLKLPGFEKQASETGLIDKPKPEVGQAGAADLAVTSAKEVANIKQDVSKLNDRLSVFESQISETNQKLDQLVSAFDSFEGRLKKIQENASSLRMEAVRDVPPVDVAAPKRATPKMESRPVEQSDRDDDRPVSRSSSTVDPSSRVQKPAATVRWQLRSAQPGKAIVMRKGGNDFQTVEVGNTLSGIGRITSIQIENGQWVVRGTQGVITR